MEGPHLAPMSYEVGSLSLCLGSISKRSCSHGLPTRPPRLIAPHTLAEVKQHRQVLSTTDIVVPLISRLGAHCKTPVLSTMCFLESGKDPWKKNLIIIVVHRMPAPVETT